jgi:hypothetical protein
MAIFEETLAQSTALGSNIVPGCNLMAVDKQVSMHSPKQYQRSLNHLTLPVGKVNILSLVGV